MPSLVQKYVVCDVGEASPLLPQRIALVDESGEPWGGAAPAKATTQKEGVVKKASAVTAVASGDATTASSGETVDPTEFAAVVALANECKAQLNDLIAKMKSAGLMA